MHRRASTRMTPSSVRYVALTGQTAVHGESSHCMHRRGWKNDEAAVLPSDPGAVQVAGKPLMPASGASTNRVPSVMVVWRSTQVRVNSEDSGTLFSSLQATTHSPQPMHLAVSTTKVQAFDFGS